MPIRNICFFVRYAERTNKGEVVVKHGAEDGWVAGCKTKVQLPTGKRETVMLLNFDELYHVLNRSPGQALQVHV